MDLDFLVAYTWVVWLTLVLVLVIIEVLTSEFTFLMLAFGCLFGGVLLALFGVPWWAQILAAGLLSLLLLLVVRPVFLRMLKRGADPALSNIEAVIGQTGTVTSDAGNAGQVKLANGETWTARHRDSEPLIKGQLVAVIAIDGATAVVSPTERNVS